MTGALKNEELEHSCCTSKNRCMLNDFSFKFYGLFSIYQVNVRASSVTVG